MKATLEFNLPEESEDHYTALEGWKYKSAVDQFFSILRAKSKYDHTVTEEQHVLIEKLREEFAEALNELDIKV